MNLAPMRSLNRPKPEVSVERRADGGCFAHHAGLSAGERQHRPWRVDAQHLDEELRQHGVELLTPVGDDVEHGFGRGGIHFPIDPRCGQRVEAVGYRDDVSEQRHALLDLDTRIATQVIVHVMLEGHD